MYKNAETFESAEEISINFDDNHRNSLLSSMSDNSFEDYPDLPETYVNHLLLKQL